MSLRYTIQSLRWIKVLWSPFKPFNIRWYAGKMQIGVPYFFPRRWVKYNEIDIKEAIIKHIGNTNKVQLPMDKLYEMYKRYTKAVPLKIGFSHCSLGWKTKWTDTDFRYEYGPVCSLVFFGYQIAILIGQEDASSYWESWLYYEYATDKTKTKRERIEQCKKEFSQKYIIYSKDNENEKIDYYDRILKKKYQ